MKTFLRIKADERQGNVFDANELAGYYDSFGIQPEYVEKVSPPHNGRPTPAENPDIAMMEGDSIRNSYPKAMLDDDDDIDDDDDLDVDDDVDVVEEDVVEEDIVEVDEDEEDLILDEDDEDDDLV
jgi:hypothetical protein